MKVCISLTDDVLLQLDHMIKLGLFPPYVKSRSAAITYMICNYDNFYPDTLQK